MSPNRYRFPATLAYAATLGFVATPMAFATHATSTPCTQLPSSSYPRVYLSNGHTDAVVYLPDAEKGSYRSSRFDWSGIVACASSEGHTFFGEWANQNDPTINDNVTGPAEEFRRDTSEVGYDEAKPGEGFLKVGVGLLQRLNDQPYKFGTVYPIVDHGTWTTKVSKRSVTFRQVLHTPLGYAYIYEKKLELDPKLPLLRLTHSLHNVGTKAITTNVYDHDFFMLDNMPTGAGMAVTFGFEPVANPPFPDALVSMTGTEILFKDTPRRGYSAQGYLTGFTGKPGEYKFHVEDRNTHVGVLQQSESALSRVYFWSTPKTICPEGYIAIDVAPGQTQKWAISYTFETP
jgi:hypothetical protein